MFASREAGSLQAVSTTSDKKNASPEKPTEKNEPSQVSEEGKILGSFKCKGKKEGKWKCDCFPDMKSTAHQHTAMIFSRIAWTSFPLLPWTVWAFFFPPGGLGWWDWGWLAEEMERDTVMIGTVMDAKSNWTVSFLCIGQIITHSPHLEVRKTEKMQLKHHFQG